MKHRLITRLARPAAAAACVFALFPAVATAQNDQEIGFAEEFALAKDREAALEKLVPGTEQFYYYHALHCQNTGQRKKLDDTLVQWKKRFKTSALREQILNRQALIDYGKDPKKTTEYLASKLNLHFNHQQEGKARAKDFPSTLDQGKITWDKFFSLALHGANKLDDLTPDAFDTLLSKHDGNKPVWRTYILNLASLPDLPNLVPMIAADLGSKESRGFGQFKIHRMLTLAQLDELARLRPEVLRNRNFVNTRLRKLRPNPDTNPAAEPAVRRAWFDAAWGFAQKLDPSFNSLKAHLLYQRLIFDRSQGRYDRALFLSYLKLPRNSPCVRPQWRRENPVVWRAPADCSRDFKEVTGLPPIGDDRALIRDYLLHFLVKEADFKAYAPWLEQRWLKAVFAEAKIVNGVGAPEDWASYLSPSAFQALKDRVDIEFDPVRGVPAPGAKGPSNNLELGIDDPVRLRLHIKNVPKLIVKVFEIDTLNYYQQNKREISTDVELDGLVPNHEKVFEYQDPPLRRVARDFEFPEIGKRRGVWVVEFIGGGKSSRAVIRKGALQTTSKIIPAGVLLTVLDEARRPVPGAGVWFGGRRFACDKQGRTVVPFTNDPGARTAVIDDGRGFAARTRFEHPEESYNLDLGAYVAAEALHPGAEATLAVRPVLELAGEPVSPALLSDVRLILVSTDLDGVTTTETVNNFKLHSDRESLHTFRVPNHLVRLDVKLAAKIKLASRGGKEIELSDSKSFEPNTILFTNLVPDLYLSRIGGRYILECLGRTGEALAGRNVNISLHRAGFKCSLIFTLRTDEHGRIDLGPLEGIASIRASLSGDEFRNWFTVEPKSLHPSVVHATTGEPVRIPFFGKLDRKEVAFFSVSSGSEFPASIVSDAFGKLSAEPGFLVAKDLAPGNYRLVLKHSHDSVDIRVSAGEKSNGYVSNKARSLELPKHPPVQLVSANADGKNLTIHVANADKSTRVHIVASRFLLDSMSSDESLVRLGKVRFPALAAFRNAWHPNLYISGRRIGDEFRYILERRYQQKFPGNMLERPELLLNPWEVRDTEALDEKLAEGEAYRRRSTGAAPMPMARRDGADAFGLGANGSFCCPAGRQCFDFLAAPPAVLYNLQPDNNGDIEIPLDAFGDRQFVQILLVDPRAVALRTVSLPDRHTAVRDLRLANALDPDRHFTEQDSVTILETGDTLAIPDIRNARFEVFDNLAAAYRYLLAVRDDATLREFSFVTRWPRLEPAEKRELYSKYACHELNFFLAMKDPEFFKSVVAPYLANKKDKTFMDDYLLGADLSRYFEPYEYARLNTPERILLASRAPERIADIRADLRDRLALIPPNPENDNRLFETALSALGMGGGKAAELEKAKSKLAKKEALEDKAGSGRRAGKPSPSAAPGREKPAALGLKSRRSESKLSGELRKKVAKRFRKADKDADLDGDGIDAPDAPAPFYRAIEKTKEWAENNYWHLPIEKQDNLLITENRFWLDFANHDGKTPFGSSHLGEAARSFHEAMLALAVLDLPFDAPESKTSIQEAKLSFTAGGPAIAFHREIKEARMAMDAPPLLVSQSWFRADDPFRMENGEKVDKFVTEEFLAGVVYGGRIVVTNPTGSRRKLEVLVQIPKGAIPVSGNRATVTRRIALDAYTTKRLETYFYFPAPGEFPCYPAHVSIGGKVVAHAKPFAFHVVRKATKIDKSSWAWLSQQGTEEQVLDYLENNNLHAVELPKIAWRFRESADFAKKALAILRRRGVFDATLWSYSIRDNDAPAIREYLLMQKRFLDSCGLYLKSPLVTIDPIERRAYQHLEYKPLVNNRAHPLGGKRKILNSRILAQYRRFMEILAQKPALDDEDKLSTVYYLFLQDRTAEALDWLAKVDPKALPTRLQFDYFQAYAAFSQGKPDAARAIAKRYAKHPVDRWRERFAAVLAQADEIAGNAPQVTDAESHAQQQEKLAAAEPALDMKIDGTRIRLTYANLDEVQIHYHEMDLEFLFSTNPFVSNDARGFSIVRPNKSETVKLPAGKHEHTIQLPREYQAKNVLVVVIGGGKKRTAAVYANDLRTSLSENFGILSVRHAKDDRPLPKTYVKVYAQTPEGPKFYKDGYTDLRGKFDYATVSNAEIVGVTKFAILVMSPENGATVLEAPVPKR